MKKQFDFDSDNPEIALEVIADGINREKSDLLCSFMRKIWGQSPTVRKSFKKRGRDKRDTAFMWLDHWNKGEIQKPGTLQSKLNYEKES